MYFKIYFYIRTSKVNRKKEQERKNLFEKAIKLIAPEKKANQKRNKKTNIKIDLPELNYF